LRLDRWTSLAHLYRRYRTSLVVFHTRTVSFASRPLGVWWIVRHANLSGNKQALSMDTYNVEVVEPSSGQRRSILLYEGIAQEEVQLIFSAAFNLTSPAVGFRDGNGIYYPFSVLAMAPKAFDQATLNLVVQNAQKAPASPAQTPTPTRAPAPRPPAPAQEDAVVASNEFVLTEDNARKAFDILDKNGDGYLHKEEFVEVLTVAYEKFLELNTRYSFAYSCLTPGEIALATARLFFADEVGRRDIGGGGVGGMDFSQFCVWYVTAASFPLCELMVLSVESLSSTLLDQYAMSPRTAKRSRSSVSHTLDELYVDHNVSELAENAQKHLKLSGENLDYLLALIVESAGGDESIGHPLYTKIFYVYLMQHSKHLTEEDTEALEVLDAIFDMLSESKEPQSDPSNPSENVEPYEPSVNVLELGALLSVLCKGQYLKTLDAVFDMYPGMLYAAVFYAVFYSYSLIILLSFYLTSPMHYAYSLTVFLSYRRALG
jgi:hypothetical protein